MTLTNIYLNLNGFSTLKVPKELQWGIAMGIAVGNCGGIAVGDCGGELRWNCDGNWGGELRWELRWGIAV